MHSWTQNSGLALQDKHGHLHGSLRRKPACGHTGNYLLFGSETRGAPDHVHEWVSERFGEHCRVCLPMRPEARSLNLAVSVGVAVYEAQRQLAARVNA